MLVHSFFDWSSLPQFLSFVCSLARLLFPLVQFRFVCFGVALAYSRIVLINMFFLFLSSFGQYNLDYNHNYINGNAP